MTESTRSAARLAAEMAWVATVPASLEDRAAALLEALGREVSYDAAWLALRDPECRTHTPLATAGYAEPLRSVFRLPDADDEVESLGLNRCRPPLLASELPVPPSELRSWADHLLPAGFRGGLAAGLFTRDGRHLGFLCLLSGSDRCPTRHDRDLVVSLLPLISHAVDRMRTVTAVADVVRDAVGGVVLTRGDDTGPLPGLPSHPVLTRGSVALRCASARLAAGDRCARFLVPDSRAGDSELLRVTVLDTTSPFDHLLAAVTVSPPGDLRELTTRQLTILGLVVEGWADRRIAAALTVSEQEVRDELAGILWALDADERTVAAVKAVRAGLYLPAMVSGVCG